MAKSIAQLTLCQVTGEEIETATKLLEKACHKLRGIPEVPPQRITDLDNATRQLNLVAFWIVVLSQQAMKSVKHRKLCCYCPVPKKDLALLRKIAQAQPPRAILYFPTDQHGIPMAGLYAPGQHCIQCRLVVFFPSNASWLSAGRSTRSIACCIETVN